MRCGDLQARYLEATVDGVRVASIYLPNGNPHPGPKFDYKLSWFKRLHSYARKLVALDAPVILAGDYNVIPEPVDAKRPAAWTNDALFQPESRAALRELVSLGLTDAIRACLAPIGESRPCSRFAWAAGGPSPWVSSRARCGRRSRPACTTRISRP